MDGTISFPQKYALVLAFGYSQSARELPSPAFDQGTKLSGSQYWTTLGQDSGIIRRTVTQFRTVHTLIMSHGAASSGLCDQGWYGGSL